MPATNPKRRILFATMGSLGDLHPVLGLALELMRRGHAICVAATPFYRTKVEALGLGFKPLRPDWDPTDTALVAQCEDIRRGPEILIRRLVLPHLRDTYDDLLDAAQNTDLMIAGEMVYPAPLIAEKLRLRWASATLSPCSFFSAHDPSVLVTAPELMYLRRAGLRVNRGILALSRAATNPWWRPIRQLRKEEGLGPGRNPLLYDKFSPDLVLALFSKALAQPQPDWPSHTVQPGFVFYDQASAEESLPNELESFLAAGVPPILFTQGSTAVHNPGSFYEASMEAARKIGRRALLIGADDSIHASSSDVFVAKYAPYSKVFSRCVVNVHQGGAGTTGVAMQSGRPMLIVPYGWDQPDHAARIVRIGSGLTVARKRYSPERAAHALRRLITEEAFQKKAAQVRSEMQAEAGTASACDSIEELLRRSF